MLNLAHKSGYINKVPYAQKKKEPPIRVPWITKDTVKTLIDKLSSDWMRSICSFALLTGDEQKFLRWHGLKLTLKGK